MEPADYTYYLSFLQFLKRRNSSEGASQSTTLFRTAIWLCNQPISAPTHQPESDMVRTCIRLALAAPARDVARAILIGAEE
jgi:hypothetical protein